MERVSQECHAFTPAAALAAHTEALKDAASSMGLAGGPGSSELVLGMALALRHPEYARALYDSIPEEIRWIVEGAIEALVGLTPIKAEVGAEVDEIGAQLSALRSAAKAQGIEL